MSVNLKSEELSLKEMICSKYDQTKAESDLIVPDLKPDIAKILQVCGKSVITQKTVQQDKAYIQGLVHLTIIYISDTGEIKSILTDLDFSHIINVAGAAQGNHIWAESEILSIDCSIVNSRKLSLKIDLGIDVKICGSQAARLITGTDDDGLIQAKYKDLDIALSSLEEEQDFRIRERLELPSGKPDVKEIIKISSRIAASDVKYKDNKVSVSGDIAVCILYTVEDNALCLTEETIAFAETLDGMTMPEGDCDGVYTIKSTDFEIEEAPDGTRRHIKLDLLLCGSFKTSRRINAKAVCDAFGTACPVKLSKSKYEIESVSDKKLSQIAHKETVDIPDYLPEVYKIYDCGGTARATDISIENGRININGEIVSDILYTAMGDNAPVSGFSHISSFSQTVEMPSIDENSICEAKLELEHAGYSINSDRSIELRFIVCLTVLTLKSQSLEIVDSIELCEGEENTKFPPAIIYFADEGESVWDIAKRYRATPEAIMKSNSLDCEELHKGQKIFIFR